MTFQPKHLILILVFAFSSCATFSREECQRMDWSAQGRASALKGETLDLVRSRFNQECVSKHGIALNEASLQQGYSEGVREFCKPDTLRNYMAEGGEYRGTCPQIAEPALTATLTLGRVLYLEKKVADLESRNSYLESQVSALQSENSSLSSRPISCPSF